MADEKFKDEKLDNAELGDVSGGLFGPDAPDGHEIGCTFTFSWYVNYCTVRKGECEMEAYEYVPGLNKNRARCKYCGKEAFI